MFEISLFRKRFFIGLDFLYIMNGTFNLGTNITSQKVWYKSDIDERTAYQYEHSLNICLGLLSAHIGIREGMTLYEETDSND